MGILLIHISGNSHKNFINLTQNVNKTIEPQYYPNYYSAGNYHLWDIEGNEVEEALITFLDLDLKSNNKLEVLAINGSQTLTSAQTSDNFVSLTLFVNLSSQSLSFEEPFSGHGLRVKHQLNADRPLI